MADLQAAREQLLERGVDAGEIQVFAGSAPRPYREGDSRPKDVCMFYTCHAQTSRSRMS